MRGFLCKSLIYGRGPQLNSDRVQRRSEGCNVAQKDAAELRGCSVALRVQGSLDWVQGNLVECSIS
jgi:hypothetical protein